MFRGIHSVNMDAKGRLAIPARFRESLLSASKGNIVLTIDPNAPNLALYSLDQWEEIQARIEALPSLNPQARRLKQLFIGYAFDLELDSNGRVLVPQKLREYAQLEKSLVLLGQGQKIEVWSEVLWGQRFDEMLNMSDGLEGLPDEMQSLAF